MSLRFARSALTAALLGLTASAAVLSQPAQAQPEVVYGEPLRDGQACAIQYVDRSLSGALYVKAAAGQSGSYRLRLRRHNDDNDVLLEMSGEFDGSASQEVVIARAFLSSRNIMDARRGQVVTQGRDVYLINGGLEIFDAQGRRTCRTRQVDVLRFETMRPLAPGQVRAPAPMPRPVRPSLDDLNARPWARPERFEPR